MSYLIRDLQLRRHKVLPPPSFSLKWMCAVFGVYQPESDYLELHRPVSVRDLRPPQERLP